MLVFDHFLLLDFLLLRDRGLRFELLEVPDVTYLQLLFRLGQALLLDLPGKGANFEVLLMGASPL